MKKDNLVSFISIGETVTANSMFKGIIVSVTIKMNSVVYEVQQTRKDGCTCLNFYDWEISKINPRETIVKPI